MKDLNWDKSILEESVKFLSEWDKRNDKYYKDQNVSNLSKKVDLAEREHLRNCIKYWSEILYEN